MRPFTAETDSVNSPTATLEGFKAFVRKANPRFRWYAHCEALARVLVRVANGELRRVMVFMPPRHSKSEEVSRLFTAYYLTLHPDRWVGLNSYAAELAYTLSRASRENYQANGGAVKDDAAAVKHWETGHGGGLWAAGVGGPITGKGFHLGVIDDPIKNAEEAASETIRAKHKEWYASTFYTREEPDGAMVIIQTRWHEDDLSGWLLSEETQGEEPEGWHVVNFPAIKENEESVLPPTCSLEPDRREPGEPLCPERYGLDRLRKIAARIGGYFWGALFQQRPTTREGSFFKVSKIEFADAAPHSVRWCRGWDLAATEGGGDYTAAPKVGQDSSGLWWVGDVARGQWGPDDVEAEIRQTAHLDGQVVKIFIPQDPGQAGKRQAQSLTRMLAGYGVMTEPVSGSKEVRAFNFAAQVNAGNVRLVKGSWNKAFIEELRTFPLGKHDDQVDGAASAFNMLAHERDVEDLDGDLADSIESYDGR